MVQDPLSVSFASFLILSEEEKGKRDYLAGELARQLGDEKNLNYYRRVVDKFPEAVLFETASIVKDIYRQGKVKKSRGAVFVDLMKRRASAKNISATAETASAKIASSGTKG